MRPKHEYLLVAHHPKALLGGHHPPKLITLRQRCLNTLRHRILMTATCTAHSTVQHSAQEVGRTHRSKLGASAQAPCLRIGRGRLTDTQSSTSECPSVLGCQPRLPLKLKGKKPKQLRQ
jgi:hypothetical protein